MSPRPGPLKGRSRPTGARPTALSARLSRRRLLQPRPPAGRSGALWISCQSLCPAPFAHSSQRRDPEGQPARALTGYRALSVMRLTPPPAGCGSWDPQSILIGLPRRHSCETELRDRAVAPSAARQLLPPGVSAPARASAPLSSASSVGRSSVVVSPPPPPRAPPEGASAVGRDRTRPGRAAETGPGPRGTATGTPRNLVSEGPAPRGCPLPVPGSWSFRRPAATGSLWGPASEGTPRLKGPQG
ncbi:uncharacterized protein DKFZp434B061-like [Cavia porcellus]|uniref:uncharacterized protein DKFZp434B061-like n=1 Tax=Cavia porcellus TaxID=10141 RepID=UPI000661B993|nr:uncharacterized protein DKFZp434B061-like [Cavia porcellus]